MNEYKPDLRIYENLSRNEIIDRYNEFKRFFPDNLFQLSDDQINKEFKEELNLGKWSCLQLIGHLTDAEYSFSHRMRRVFSENDPKFETWDEISFLDRDIYSNINVHFYTDFLFSSRKLLFNWLNLLSDIDFERKGKHPVNGFQSLRTILNYSTWHLEHHGSFLLKKIEFLTK